MATSTDFSTRVLGKINDQVLGYSLEDSEIGNRNKINQYKSTSFFSTFTFMIGVMRVTYIGICTTCIYVGLKYYRTIYA